MATDLRVPAVPPVLVDRDGLREELVRETCLELAEHLRDAAANAKPYIREMADFMVAPKRLCPPSARGMHPLIAQLVRELMRDVEIARRCR
jgi:hypothetical protein